MPAAPVSYEPTRLTMLFSQTRPGALTSVSRLVSAWSNFAVNLGRSIASLRSGGTWNFVAISGSSNLPASCQRSYPEM